MPQAIWNFTSNDVTGWQINREAVAASEFYGVSTPSSSKADIWFQTGLKLLKSNQVLPAIQALQNAITFDPASVQSYLCLGEIFETLGFWYEAAIAYETALKLNNTDFKVALKLACALEQLNFFGQAAEIYKFFITNFPDSTVFQKKFQQISLLAAEHLKSALTPDGYKTDHATAANNHWNVRGKKCLIIGCAKGNDCAYFIKFWAACVHGVDVLDDIGINFQHPLVNYFKISAEKMTSIPSDSYDLVYSVATMEHVLRIDMAFSEMARVTKPGGLIYSFSAPLWNSRDGHHFDVFPNHPWIHLRLNPVQLFNFCIANGIKGPNNMGTEELVQRVYDKTNFNMTPASKYIEVCAGLPNVAILKNKLSCDDEKYLTPEIYDELQLKGYSRQELLSTCHVLIARKLPRL
jgi:ubiquinone/menaquinone biosynthesis C-methylase UbiE